MNDNVSKKSVPSFAHLKLTKVDAIVSLIKHGDRIPGDELLQALQEHEEGKLPAEFLEYLSKPLSGWIEKKPGRVPKSADEKRGEKMLLRTMYQMFKAGLTHRAGGVLNVDADVLEDLSETIAEYESQIDSNLSVSDAAAQILAVWLGKDKRQGRGLLNKMYSSK